MNPPDTRIVDSRHTDRSAGLDLTLQAAFANINIAKSTMPETVNEIIAETEIFEISYRSRSPLLC